MPNELDEMTGPVSQGRETGVIEVQIYPKTGVGTIIFEIILWVLGIIPGLILLIKKIKAYEYLQRLQQKIQHNASQIDNYMEQRFEILKNVAPLVEKSINLDKETFTKISELRSGLNGSDQDNVRNELSSTLDSTARTFYVAFENYPELQAHSTIQEAMEQNQMLQKQITAARELYNDSVFRWNSEIFVWPCNRIVASKRGYKTRIPFAISQDAKEQAKKVYF